LRQFVFLAPDHFVIADRVISTKPEYRKTWLQHTAEEPRLDGTTFTAAQEEGRLFCRTLLPEKPAISIVGGPGKQFWSDGRNWPLPASSKVPNTHPLLGQWRVEVSPRNAVSEDLFLHVIQTGAATDQKMAATRLLRENGRTGAAFRSGAAEWQVLFDNQGPAGGRIRLRVNGAMRIDRELTREVMSQAGLYGSGL
jgi:heparin/heparan-sulfate lyase